jgi:tripartite-type tricarboxylate transporter receptor subunit TctC
MIKYTRAILAGLGLMLFAAAAQAAYPERPITLIVPWAAGGGTDATARIIGTLLEKELGQPVNVVNRVGGSGVVGHSAIAQAAPDGYTIGIITVEIGMMHWQGLTDLNGASYTPLALVNADPAGVQVAADSPYKTVNDLVAAIKANPGKFKASGTGQGGIWHLAIAGMLQDLKVDPASVPWVPSGGAAPGLLDLVAGGVQIAPVSLPEARAMIDAGKVKSLAVMSDKPASLYPNVPTLKSATGKQLDDGRLARHRGAEEPSARGARQAGRRIAEDRRQQGIHRVHGQAGLWGDLRGARRFRQVHGQVGLRPRRHDEGRRHRQVTCWASPRYATRGPRRRRAASLRNIHAVASGCR